jgi:F-box protein 11
MTKNSQPRTVSKERIRIYENSYQLPVLFSPFFLELRENIKNRQILVQKGIRSQSQWFGLIKTEELISFEERFSELEKLVRDYDSIIHILKKYQEAYQLFFVQVVDELKTFVAKQCQELAEAERERLELEKSIQDNENLLSFLKSQKLQILRSAFLLHRAAQLVLRKVELIENSIKKLAQEQETQRALLEKMMERLKNYIRVSRLQQKINWIEENIRNLADVAVNFEDYLKDYFGSFQNVIEQVIEIDNELSSKVEEIRILVEDIRNQNSSSSILNESENLSDSLLDFLVQSNFKQEKLRETFERVRQENDINIDRFDLPEDLLKKTSVITALDSIQCRVNTQLIQRSWAILCIVVSKQSNGDYQTIQEAINNARSGMRILVRPGLYLESLVIDKPLEILGDGKAQDIIIQSPDSDCLLMQTDYAVVRNLTLQGSARHPGDKDFVANIPQGQLIIEDCYITSASLACIAIHGDKANPIIKRCSISYGKESGISVYANGQGVIEDCNIFGNGLAGVTIQDSGNPIIRRCRIYEGDSNGILVYDGGQGIIENCEIFNNINAGVEIRESGHPIIRDCKIYEGKTSGIFVHTNGQGIIKNCDIFSNGLQGVAIEEGGNPVIYQCRIYQEKEYGILVYQNGKGIIKDCQIFDNVYAGVEIREGSNPFIHQCKIYHNEKRGIVVTKNGKGIVKGCDIFDNIYAGVEITEGGNPLIRKCKIHQSGKYGVLFDKNSKGTVKDCDIFDNTCAEIKIGEGSNPSIQQCQLESIKDNKSSIPSHFNATIDGMTGKFIYKERL